MFFLTLAAGILLGIAVGTLFSAMEMQRGSHCLAPRGYKKRRQFTVRYRIIGVSAVCIWLAVAIPTHLNWFSWASLIGAVAGMILLDVIENRLAHYRAEW